MRKTLNRVLACCLAVALLVSCCISGLVLPAAAGAMVVEGQNLITNSADVKLELTGGKSQAPTFNLSQPLEVDKRYVLRFKMSGGSGKLYHDASKIDTLTEHGYATTITFEAPAADCWNEVFLFFSAKTQINSLTGVYFYDSTNAEGVTVTYKDFVIYEYVAGTNLVPGSDGSAYPITGERGAKTAAKSFFGNFTMSLANDAGNAVWKITSANQYVRDIHTLSLLKNSGKQVVVSFRFKGVNGGTVTPTAQAVSGITLNSQKTSSTVDAQGYKTFTANLTFKDTGWSAGYTYKLAFSGDTEVYIDDFFYGEYVEEPVTIDITETTQTVEEGKTVTLGYTVTLADTAVEWTSSDETIATVANGVVTGVKAGTVTITATIAEGVFDMCEVTVTEKPIIAPGINLIPDGSFDNGTIDFGFAISQSGGVGGSKALVIQPNTSSGKVMSAVTLHAPIKANVPYILRYKVKGGTVYVNWKDEAVGGNCATSSTANSSAGSDTFVQVQRIVVATEELTTLANFKLYNTHTTEAAYLDDLQMMQYVPGMNLWPDLEECVSLPLMYPFSTATDTYEKTLFEGFDVVTAAQVDGKTVLKFSQLSETTVTTRTLRPVLMYDFTKILDNTDRKLVVSFRYKGNTENAKAYIASANAAVAKTFGKPTTTAPDENGWRTHTAILDLLSVGLGGTLNLNFIGATEVMIADFYISESVNLAVSDLTWTPNQTQLTTGTDMKFWTTVSNVGTEPVDERTDITVKFIANKGETPVLLGTAVHKGGLEVGQSVVVTLPTTWKAPAGEWVVSAHVSTTFGTVEEIATQGHFRVADTALMAPGEALAAGFDTLTFSDDFEFANVDTEYTGDYGYKWYLTDTSGITGDETDYSITNGVMTTAGKNMRGTWLLSTVNAYTAAGWHGFNHGYLEYRTRFDSTPIGFTGTDYSLIDTGGAPAIWSFPPEVIAPSVLGDPKRYVEMDWMEYWGYDKNNCLWTITMGDMVDYGETNQINNFPNSHIQKKENNIGDGQWHIVGYRWEEGLLIAYLDGREIFRQTWGENGLNSAANVITGDLLDDAFSPLDDQLSALIIGSGDEWPMEIDYIRVWQKGSDEIVEEPIEDFGLTMNGTSLHYTNGEVDGVRFGTRLDFGSGYKVNAETEGLQLSYNNKYYDVISMGTLLRRHGDGELTIQNAKWTAIAYDRSTNELKYTQQDKNGEYIIFSVAMMTRTLQPEVFYAREYDARGYIQLNIDGVIKTIYTEVYTDSVNGYLERYAVKHG